MPQHEVVIGIGKSDGSYGYIAVEPPISNDMARIVQRALPNIGTFITSETETVFDAHKENPSGWTKLELMAFASGIVRSMWQMGNEAVLHEDHCEVDGIEPILEQFRQQRKISSN